MSTIEFACTSCGKKMKTGAANAGKKGKCPKCGTVLDIPNSGETPLMPPSSPPVKPAPTNPAPAQESPMKPPARPKGEDELFGASSGSTVSWDANQDFLSELAGPAAGGAGPLGGQPAEAAPQDLFGGANDAAGAYGSSTGLTPLPDPPQPAYTPSTYAPSSYAAPAPAYAPAPTYSQGGVSPYSDAAAPVYGGYAARPQKGSSDGPGITSMVLGIVGLVGSFSSCCLSFAYIGVIGYPICIVLSIVGLVLGYIAKPGGMRTAGLVMNYVNLGLYVAGLLLVVILFIFGFSMAALSQR